MENVPPVDFAPAGVGCSTVSLATTDFGFSVFRASRSVTAAAALSSVSRAAASGLFSDRSCTYSVIADCGSSAPGLSTDVAPASAVGAVLPPFKTKNAATTTATTSSAPPIRTPRLAAGLIPAIPSPKERHRREWQVGF